MNWKIKSGIDIMASGERLKREFFIRDVLEVAPDLLSKIITIRLTDGTISRCLVTEVEAYRGAEDKACHACKGRTPRTEIMFHEGGHLYIYLIYGMYWMLNIVTGLENDPQAVLIRGVENVSGPGRVTKTLGIDRTFNCEDLITSERMWIEDSPAVQNYKTGPRIGIDYAGEFWKSKPWRYYIDEK
jgi:DNA-3-methyladenine glycosylase